MHRPSAGATTAVTLTCLAAALCFGGAVTSAGLLLGVLPSALVVGLLSARLVARGRPLGALALGAGLGLALAEAANLLSGDTNGPTARSTAVATLMTALAVTSLSRGPALFLLPVAGLVSAAMVLGAAGEVGVPVLLAAALATWALASAHGERQQWTGPRTGRPAVTILTGIVVAAAAVSVLAQQVVRDEPPALQAVGQLDATIVPGTLFTLPQPRDDSPAAEGGPPPPSDRHVTEPQPGGSSRLLNFPHVYRPPTPRLPR
jgi:hypothetical protein